MNISYTAAKKLPISKYDFFGYFIPGIVFFSSLFFYEYLLRCNLLSNNDLFFYKFIQMQLPYFSTNSNWIISITLVFLDLILIYTFGHVISSISSLFIDRILIYKGYGYPYEFLLMNVEPDKFMSYENYFSLRFSPTRTNIFSSFLYRSMYFYINFIFVFYFITKTISIPYSNLFYYFFIFLIILVIILKLYLKDIRDEKRHPILSSIYLKILPAPYNFFSDIFSNYLNTKRGFSEEFIDKYKTLYKKIFNGLNPEKQETNNFWLPYCYVIEKSDTHGYLLNNWLSLYSFARNLSTSFYLVFLYILFFRFFNLYNIHKPYSHIFVNALPFIFLFLSILMLIRFYFLYVNYYTKFLFRSFVTLALIETDEKANKTLNTEFATRATNSVSEKVRGK